MMMRSQLTVIILIGIAWCPRSLSAQKFVDHRLTFSIGYEVNHPIGKKNYSTGSYTAPSLVTNFKRGNSVELAANYKITKLVHVGLGVTNSGFGGWTYKGHNRFNDAYYSVLAFHPELEIRTPFKETGKANRFAFFARTGPALGLHAVTLQRSPFTTAQPTDFDFNHARFYRTGFSFTAGCYANLTNKLVLGLSYGITRYAVSSPLFDDDSFTFNSIKVRLGYKLALNKRYKYAPRWFD